MMVRFGSGYLKFEDGGPAVRAACFCSLSVQVSDCGHRRGLKDLNFIEWPLSRPHLSLSRRFSESRDPTEAESSDRSCDASDPTALAILVPFAD